jgi:hypothetical protein
LERRERASGRGGAFTEAVIVSIFNPKLIEYIIGLLERKKMASLSLNEGVVAARTDNKLEYGAIYAHDVLRS